MKKEIVDTVDTKRGTCPECSSRHIWLKGRVPSRSGPKQRYCCVVCGCSFYQKDKKVHTKPASSQ